MLVCHHGHMGLIFFLFHSYPFLHCTFVRHFLNIGGGLKAPTSPPPNFLRGTIPLSLRPCCYQLPSLFHSNLPFQKILSSTLVCFCLKDCPMALDRSPDLFAHRFYVLVLFFSVLVFLRVADKVGQLSG